MSAADANLDMEELRRRAWETTVPANGDYQAQADERLDWLGQASPEEWHRFATGFNWSDDIAPLYWIARHEQCEMATALHVFWHACPEWELMKLAGNEPIYERDEAMMVEYIAKRIAAKGYKRRKIAWDAEPMHKRDFEDMKGFVSKIDDPPWRPHRDMIKPIWGKEVMDGPEAWEERPENVRTGFWLDLPKSNIVTWDMREARDEMRPTFFNLFAIGGLIAASFEFVNDPAKWWLHLVGAIVMIGWWSWGISNSTSTVRSLMRSEMKTVPTQQMAIIYLALIALGVLWLKAYFGLSALFAEAKDTSFEARAIKAAICAVWIAPFWFGLRWLSEQYTYRVLFR
ncbi:hypothetical protein NAP1_10978 [Erythrobacter sp. NAP1]|uniref:DUF4274 domain-containing protein n=1 Tax=Erythrobacter sp. NAP1 TaxID=237727 RepID=UPI0000687A04|nr:DUF4274 domain-containing protein [Erythrobacter sp. NAP1]EAQ28113.1 hypothetical protein NAP1_10978 [Erythrobacter sp. NAP1]